MYISSTQVDNQPCAAYVCKFENKMINLALSRSLLFWKINWSLKSVCYWNGRFGFDSRSGQTKVYKNNIHSFLLDVQQMTQTVWSLRRVC